jgi:hypothetical protein
VNLVGGPRSAFARLFPDRYREEQEQFSHHQRSKSSDDQRYNFDRDCHYQQQHPQQQQQQHTVIDDYHSQDMLSKSDRMTFNTDELNQLRGRARSESRLNDTTHQYYNISSTGSIHSDEVKQMPLNYDPDPEIVYRDNPDKLVYIQKVGIRYLKPPTPPTPGALLIREVQATPPPEPPPLVITTTP